MAITREDVFVSRGEGEWRNSSELVIAISLWMLHIKTAPPTTVSLRCVL
jgi:hypothetical protein